MKTRNTEIPSNDVKEQVHLLESVIGSPFSTDEEVERAWWELRLLNRKTA